MANEEDAAQIEEIIRYRFRNPQLLRDAVVHSSCDPQSSIKKLAFIGDSVLGLLLTWHLYETYPELQPAHLTPLRSRNVDKKKFARAAVKKGLHHFIRLKEPNLQRLIDEFVETMAMETQDKSYCNGDFKPPRLLSETIESIAGAVLVDGGYSIGSIGNVWKVMRPLLEPIIGDDSLEPHPVTPEMPLANKEGQQLLHTYCQKKHWPNPEYREIKDEGPPHQKKYIYSVRVKINNCWSKEFYSKPMPRTNEARNLAAKELLNFLQENENPIQKYKYPITRTILTIISFLYICFILFILSTV